MGQIRCPIYIHIYLLKIEIVHQKICYNSNFWKSENLVNASCTNHALAKPPNVFFSTFLPHKFEFSGQQRNSSTRQCCVNVWARSKHWATKAWLTLLDALSVLSCHLLFPTTPKVGGAIHTFSVWETELGLELIQGWHSSHIHSCDNKGHVLFSSIPLEMEGEKILLLNSNG